MTTVEQWAATGSYLNWRNQRIFVRSRGSGAAILLIHGFPTSSWDWHRITDALQTRFQVISFDMLGFGLSDKPKDFSYTVNAQADLAEEVLAHFAVTNTRILAHDFGDTVTQELLARQQTGSCTWQLQQVFLLNGGLFPEAHQPLRIQKLLASPIGGLIATFTRYRHFAASMQGICARPLGEADLVGMWQLICRQHGLRIMPKLIGYMAERVRHRDRWVGALANSAIPIRLINGNADPISGGHMVSRYRELLANPDVVDLAGIGHYPQLEAPAAVVRAVLAADAPDSMQPPTA